MPCFVTFHFVNRLVRPTSGPLALACSFGPGFPKYQGAVDLPTEVPAPFVSVARSVQALTPNARRFAASSRSQLCSATGVILLYSIITAELNTTCLLSSGFHCLRAGVSVGCLGSGERPGVRRSLAVLLRHDGRGQRCFVFLGGFSTI